MFKKEFAFLLLILVLAFILRTYRITAPLADWHSWRQADTAAVARNFVNQEIDLLKPKYDDLSTIASGQENPQGYRMVEFPIFAFLHSLFFKLFSFVSFETGGRLLSIFFSLGTIIFLFLIVGEIAGLPLALITAFFYAVLPYNIYYNRVILPEPMMIATSLGSVYFFIKGTNSIFNFQFSIFNFFLSSIFFIIALLLKPFALFLILPPVLYIFIKKFFQSKKKLYLFIGLFIYLFIGLLPFAVWRLWIQQFPEGIPANMWLLNGDEIRFKGAWFYWLFAERLAKLILGYWGVIFLAFGLLRKASQKSSYLFHFWFLSCLAYLAVVATGNVRHDYYQILIIPVVCIFLARGVLFLLKEARKIFSSLGCWLLAAGCFLFMESFGWYQVRDFFNINHPEIVAAGQQVKKLSQEEDKVIAPYGGDTAFLYQTERKGWPIGGNIEDRIKKGASFYVTVKKDQELKDLKKQCLLLEEQESFAIVDLRRCDFR